MNIWAGARRYNSYIHDSEDYVAVVYGLRGVFPFVQLDRTFAISKDDDLARPGFLGREIDVLRFDCNNQCIDCCVKRGAKMRDDDIDGN
jgi:hypothetical protein